MSAFKYKSKMHFILNYMCVSILVLVFTLFGRTASALERLWPDNLFAVEFISEDRGFVAGESGTVLRTIDGGESWQLFYVGSPELIRRMSFVSPDEGWAIGHRGSIFHTSDAGENWEKQYTQQDNYLRDVVFVNSNNGWAVGHSGLILHTNDGGKTWEKQTLKGYRGRDIPRLHGIHALDDGNKLIAVGEFGVIAHTENGGDLWVVTPVENDITWLSVSAHETGKCIFVAGLDGNAACLEEATPEQRAKIDLNQAQQVALAVEKARKKAERRRKQYIPGAEAEIIRGDIEYVITAIDTGTDEHLFDVAAYGNKALVAGRSTLLEIDEDRGVALDGGNLPVEYLWFGGIGISGSNTFWSAGIRGSLVKGEINQQRFEQVFSLATSPNIEVINSRWKTK